MRTLILAATLALMLVMTAPPAAAEPVCVEDTCAGPHDDEDPYEWLERDLGLGPCHCPPPGQEPLPL